MLKRYNTFIILFLLFMILWPAFGQTDMKVTTMDVVTQQKLIFIPDSLKNYDLNNDTSRWSWRHSVQTQNFIFFWERGFGDDPYNPPRLKDKQMAFDIGNLEICLERFYHFFRDTLQFTKPGSISGRYKMMVMLNYSLEGTAYGGTYDDFVGALWVAPNRIQDKKLNCLAHELGHSFQLQIIADKAGGAWGGSGFFEMTSQWMLWKVNPSWMTDESYHFEAFKKLAHKGFLHSNNIYHSPYVIEWWAEKHGVTSIADLYREGKVGEDPVVTYKRIYNMTQKQFNDELFDCYRHLVNFDFQHARKETRPYACTFYTPMVDQAVGGWQRPDRVYFPENYGFNAIRLMVPTDGRRISVDFRALPTKDKTVGYRYGLVAITTDDKCIYDSMFSKPKQHITMTIPKDTVFKALYLVVMGAPLTHSFDPSSRMFPYEIRIR